MKYFFSQLFEKNIFDKIFSSLKYSTFKPCFTNQLKLVNEINHTIAAFIYDVC